MIGKYIENIRSISPLIHNITNYVTVNDCANILLAAGASPIMADDIGEVRDITSICAALNINIGTLNQRTVPAMFAAGERANELNHPVVLDPVGVGASSLRTTTAMELTGKINFTVIRGNISEIKALAAGSGGTKGEDVNAKEGSVDTKGVSANAVSGSGGTNGVDANAMEGSVGTKGVDANAMDAVTDQTLDTAINFIKDYSKQMNTIIAVTGAIDIVADKDKVFIIRNGRPEMGRVTGAGCMLSCLVTASVAANPGDELNATAAAVSAMGLAGEIAAGRMKAQDGNASYRGYIIDAIYNMDAGALDKGARCEIG